MIEDVDSDGDGKINYAEYKILCGGNWKTFDKENNSFIIKQFKITYPVSM